MVLWFGFRYRLRSGPGCVIVIGMIDTLRMMVRQPHKGFGGRDLIWSINRAVIDWQSDPVGLRLIIKDMIWEMGRLVPEVDVLHEGVWTAAVVEFPGPVTVDEVVPFRLADFEHARNLMWSDIPHQPRCGHGKIIGQEPCIQCAETGMSTHA